MKELGTRLHLDSGTLTPLLKKLEAEKLVIRERSAEDERKLNVTITPKGKELQVRAAGIPEQMGSCIQLSPQDAADLYRILYQMLENNRS